MRLQKRVACFTPLADTGPRVDHAPMPLAYGLTEPVTLALTHLPHALDQMRIAHITDLHLLKRTKRLDRMIYQLAKVRLDLGVLTGDYILRQYQRDQALPYLTELTKAVKPALGWYGVFGNHDRDEVIDKLGDLPINWLIDDAVALPDKPVDIVGLRCKADRLRPDPIAAAQSVARLPNVQDERDKRLRIVLSHRPDFLPLASDLGADLMLSGHTHGGQIRIPLINLPFYNSSDLPLHLSSGLIRHRDTLGAISRGLGSTGLMGSIFKARLFCPPHAPIYTLRRNPSQGTYTDDIMSIWRW